MESAVPLLHDYLIASARRLPEKVALVCRGERLTYAEIDARSDALARALARRGVRRGDRVVVFGENGVLAAVAFWGALKANAVVSVVNPLTKGEKLAYLLNDCRAAALVAEGHLAPVVLEAAGRAPHLRAVVASHVAGASAEARAAERLLARPGAVLWDAALAAERDAPPRREAIDVDLAAIVYTSGSTGEPKGVMLTHRNMLTAALSISTALDYREEDVVLDVLPLAFDYGLYQMIMAFRVGARLVLERSFAYPPEVLDAVVEHEVTIFPGLPTIFAILAGMPSLPEYDLSRVRSVTSTAAALPRKQVEFLKRAFLRARIYSMYGLTECKRCTILPPEDLDRKPDSVGLAIPNTEMWIEDAAGRRLGPGEVGELVIRGATVMRGYWEKPAETADRLKPGPLPGEMVLHTGDLCRIDDDGYLYFVGRKDDIIKSRGEKVAPREVEMALVAVPGVREAAVVGAPDEVLGEAVIAYVVLERGALLAPKEIQRACAARLETFMVPKEVRIVRDLPRTATGKVDKGALR